MTNRSLAVLFGAFALLAAPLARAESPAGKAGNEMEKKGNAAEKSADAEKAKSYEVPRENLTDEAREAIDAGEERLAEEQAQTDAKREAAEAVGTDQTTSAEG